MSRLRPSRLREATPKAPRAETVIDTRFKVLNRNGHTRWRAFWNWELAFALAAGIGLLLPPAWAVLQEVMAMLRGD